MKAIEFDSVVRNGWLQLPDNGLDLNQRIVRIILLYAEDDSPQTSEYVSDDIRTGFKLLQKHNPFHSVSDPISWQKQIRDEWE
jgi:hypothetical protein